MRKTDFATKESLIINWNTATLDTKPSFGCGAFFLTLKKEADYYNGWPPTVSYMNT
jgi:hypothetical protein